MESSNARAKLTEELEADSGDAASSQLAKLTRLEKKIEIAERNVERMERVLNIQNSDRWPKSSAQYAAAREKKARDQNYKSEAKIFDRWQNNDERSATSRRQNWYVITCFSN